MAQKYQELVEEDLNVGTGTCWVTAPTSGAFRSTQIGLHSFARGQKEYTATWAPGAIAAGSKASTTVTVPTAAVADFVTASHDQILTDSLRILGHVSAANTAKVVIHNPTASSVTVASGTVSVLVFPVIAQTPPAATGSVSGTVRHNEMGPINGATVEITAQGLSTVTAGAGAYSFPTVAAGAVTVTVTAATGYVVPDNTNGTVIAGQNNVINVTMVLL